MKVVADASVTIAWLFADSPAELLGDQAMVFFDAFAAGRITLVQSPHWLAETLAVVAMKAPRQAEEIAAALKLLALDSAVDLAVYRRGVALSTTLNHHLFDTLYHALAIEIGATLITADMRYFNKAEHLGSIESLPSFRVRD